MKIPSYTDKTYIVASSDARIRRADNLAQVETYQAGDEIPAGSAVGDIKRLPKDAAIKVTDVKTDANRVVYVFAEPVSTNDEIVPSGWTKALNLKGKFLNEIVGFAPADWDFAPAGNNFTITDKQSLIRGGKPNFISTGNSIPIGSYVLVTEKSDIAGKNFVKVSLAEISNGEITAKEEIGWTSAANLTDGCSKYFASVDWLDTKGGNACWKRGSYIGTKILVNIVGTDLDRDVQMEQITLESVEPYFKLCEAAAAANLQLAIESGFRTYQHQEKLRKKYDLFKSGQGPHAPEAAKPGRSNHQHGQAFDFNTRVGVNETPLYAWLTKNAPKFGFLRTVPSEHWHWEYLPEQAKTIAQNGGFSTF